MYVDELRHEQHRSILADIRRWQAVIETVAAGWTRVRRALAGGREDAGTAFHVHRVPGTDALR